MKADIHAAIKKPENQVNSNQEEAWQFCIVRKTHEELTFYMFCFIKV